MAKTYQIAVIGDWESVMGFRALGLDTYPVTSVEEAKEKVRELLAELRYLGVSEEELLALLREGETT